MNSLYNNNDYLTKKGLMDSYIQSQEIIPNELRNENPLLKSRDSFEAENTVIKKLNDDIYSLNSRINVLLIENQKVEQLKSENDKYSQQINILNIQLENSKKQLQKIDIDIKKYKGLIYDKYNTDIYRMIRYISKNTGTDFDTVHIITQQLNINAVNKGTINEIIDKKNKFNEKKKDINLTD